MASNAVNSLTSTYLSNLISFSFSTSSVALAWLFFFLSSLYSRLFYLKERESTLLYISSKILFPWEGHIA